MQIHRQKSKVQKIFGLIIGSSFALGLVGLGIILAVGFSNTPLYWNGIWIFMSLLSVGMIGARVYGMMWSK